MRAMRIAGPKCPRCWANGVSHKLLHEERVETTDFADVERGVSTWLVSWFIKCAYCSHEWVESETREYPFA